MSLETIVSENCIRQFVENNNKTHKEISLWLRERFTGMRGISERSVRRYCATHTIHKRDSALATEALQEVVSSAIQEVRSSLI